MSAVGRKTVIKATLGVLVQTSETVYVGPNGSVSRFEWYVTLEGRTILQSERSLPSEAIARREAGSAIRAWAGRVLDSARILARVACREFYTADLSEETAMARLEVAIAEQLQKGVL